MNYYFSRAYNSMKKHAMERFPEESCGVIVKYDKYVPLENEADDPIKDFKINTELFLQLNEDDQVKAIVHSHVNFFHASKQDMQAQINTAKPWGIVFLDNDGVYVNTAFWGDQLETQTLIGRPFYGGIYDCYSIVRDAAKVLYDYDIPNVPRNWDFWNNPDGNAHFEDHLAYLVPDQMHFVKKSEGLKEGDVLLFKLNSQKVWNHSGIYVGNDKFLTHMEHQLSMRKTAGLYLREIDAIARPNKTRKLKEWH